MSFLFFFIIIFYNITDRSIFIINLNKLPSLPLLQDHSNTRKIIFQKRKKEFDTFYITNFVTTPFPNCFELNELSFKHNFPLFVIINNTIDPLIYIMNKNMEKYFSSSSSMPTFAEKIMKNNFNGKLY